MTETVDGIVYSGDCVVKAKRDITVARLREGTVRIRHDAFRKCRKLASVEFSSSLKT